MRTVIDSTDVAGAVPRTRVRVALRAACVALLTAGTLALAYGLVQMWCSGIIGRTLLILGEGDPRLLAESLPQLLQLVPRDGVTLYLEDLPAWVRVLALS